MKLEYGRNWKRFFFVTVGVDVRRPVVSRLVDEKPRTVLTLLGEVVKAARLAFHLVGESLTLSEFIIMPDHIRFIPIIDDSKEKLSPPLFIAHRRLRCGALWIIGGAGVSPELRACGEPRRLRTVTPGRPRLRRAAVPRQLPRNERLGRDALRGSQMSLFVTFRF